jgi:hypothetical protein
MENNKQPPTREATTCHEKRGRGELAARTPTLMKKFLFRWISCGCVATVALSLLLTAVAGTKNTDAAGNQTTKVTPGHSGSGAQAAGNKKITKSSQGTSLAGTQSGKHGGKKGKPDAAPVQGNAVRVPSAALLSDLRVKNNISFVGWSPMGIPIYRFSYITEPNKRYQGTIAQAIVPIRPDAVIWQNGVMFVDYSRLDVEMEELPSASVEDGYAPLKR